MSLADPASSRDFFQRLHIAFDEVVRNTPGQTPLDGPLMALGFDSFDGTAKLQEDGDPPLACHRGCTSCCMLRVGASAPEVLLVSRFLQVVSPQLRERGIDLIDRLRRADALTRAVSGPERLRLRQPCPFVARGACVIYAVRPLACRGHASHDSQACHDAMHGRAVTVPYSRSLQWVRSIVQNALQSSLREAGLAWGLYELNHAVLLAIDHPQSEPDWRAGADLFAPAALRDVALSEMAHAFDQLKRDRGLFAEPTDN